MKKICLILLVGLIYPLFAKEVDIQIKKMHCPLCTTMIKKAILKVDGVKEVKVRLNTKKAHVDFDESKTNTDEILQAIKTTSYTGIIVKD
jgi:mercuric ion binding protein